MAYKLAVLGNWFNVRTAWHAPGDLSPVGHAVNGHLDLASPNFGIQEGAFIPSDAVREIFPGTPEIRKGYLFLNEAPGHGVDLDERAREVSVFDARWQLRPEAISERIYRQQLSMNRRTFLSTAAAAGTNPLFGQTKTPQRTSELYLHPRRRSRLERPWMLWSSVHQDTESRSTRKSGHTVHTVLRKLGGMFPKPCRLPDGEFSRSPPDPQCSRYPRGQQAERFRGFPGSGSYQSRARLERVRLHDGTLRKMASQLHSQRSEADGLRLR